MTIGCETLLTAPRYYAVLNQATVEGLKTQGYYELIGSPEEWGEYGIYQANGAMPQIEETLAQNIERGWVFAGQTIAEAAEAAGLPNLEATVRAYDEMCATGEDTQSGKPAFWLRPVETGGPYYVMQFDPARFSTMGGCRTDCQTRALREDWSAIDGLYIAGMENGSLWARPYYTIGGLTSGLSFTSGKVAGRAMAAYIQA